MTYIADKLDALNHINNSVKTGPAVSLHLQNWACIISNSASSPEWLKHKKLSNSKGIQDYPIKVLHNCYSPIALPPTANVENSLSLSIYIYIIILPTKFGDIHQRRNSNYYFG